MLLTIDFLILNFKGSLTEQKRPLKIADENPFSTVRHQYGNKTFTDVYDLFYNDFKVGTLNSNPRANIIDSRLIQFQFENHLFYTSTLADLLQLVREFVGYFAVEFDAINRLDIAIDRKENRLKYHELYNDLLAGTKLLKGREKNISAHSVTKKGRGQFNGFTVGKRGSARFLRIYNKSEALRDTTTPKPYITDWHNNNNMAATPGLDIWRFEYQLNARFFTDLRKYGKNITYQIFELETLINLIEFAQKNHFEVVYNTGKSETNKEKRAYDLFDWQMLYDTLKDKTRTVISKIKRVFEPSINIQKRLIKSLFRQYYIEPNLAFLYPLIKIVNEYNLRDWFREKYTFYLHEFLNKEKIKDTFNESFFVERFNLLAL